MVLAGRGEAHAVGLKLEHAVPVVLQGRHEAIEQVLPQASRARCGAHVVEVEALVCERAPERVDEDLEPRALGTRSVAFVQRQ
ncbi:MAG: hypothetical protein M5U28_14160 [Sandaracinaceae bacterium]|nr:hypothetical protein [Sandaracinaceae bacterium]